MVSSTSTLWRYRPPRCTLRRIRCFCTASNAAWGIWAPAPVVEENEVIPQIERGKAFPDPRNRKIRHEFLLLLLLLELLIDRVGVIGKSRFKLWVLAEILVLLHVYALPDLLQAGLLLIQRTHLLIEIVQVVAKSMQFGLCG